MPDRIGKNFGGKKYHQDGQSRNHDGNDAEAFNYTAFDQVGFLIKFIFVGTDGDDPIPRLVIKIADYFATRFNLSRILPGVADPALALSAHLFDERGAVGIFGGIDVLALGLGVDGQGPLAIHAVDVTGLADLLRFEPGLELVKRLAFRSRVLVGFIQVTASSNNPVPGLIVAIDHHLLSGGAVT